MKTAFLAGAAALALSSLACRPGGGDAATPQPAPAPDLPVPHPGPADLGVVAPRASGAALAGGRIALLGQGRDALASDLTASCLAGGTIARDDPRTIRRLAHPFTAAEVEALLATGDVPTRLQLAHETSIPAELVRLDPRSLALVYGVEIRTGTTSLDLASATIAQVPGTPGFTWFCGDEVLVETELGAHALLMIRVDFPDDAARARFAELVGEDVALWDLPARLAGADGALRGSYRLSFLWRQHGGDALHLMERMGDLDDRIACARGAAARCTSLADAFVAYTSGDGPDDLPAQAQREPVHLGHRFEPWSSVIADAAPPRTAPAEVAGVRAELAGRLDDRLRVIDRTRTLRKFRSGGVSPVTLEEAERVAVSDVALLRWALSDCWESLRPADAAALERCAGWSPAKLEEWGYVGKPALSEL